MKVRAKFVVNSIEDFGMSKTVKLSAVTSGSKENEQFFKWTPCATISLSTLNEEASKQFSPGKFFYVDFEGCE